MRNRTIAIAVMLFLCTTALVTAQQSAADLFRQGSAKEQVGDCEGAIPLYERIVRQFPSARDREQVARAKLHLGDCFIKKTKADEGKGMAYLNDVATNYKELTDLVNEANRLKALSRPAVRSDAPQQIATSFTDDPFSFAISPDGLLLVVQATTEGGKQLWRQPVDGSKKPVPIAGTENAGLYAFPFFSPDGQNIGFFAEGKLKRVSVDGGKPQDIAALPSFRGGTWSNDDIIVYADGGRALNRIRADGSDLTVVTNPAGSSQVSPKFLSDGLRFLFVVANAPNQILSLGAVDHRARSAIQPIDAQAAAFASPDRIVYVAGGGLMAQRLDGLNVRTIGNPIRLAERVALNRNWPGIAALSVSAAGPVAYRVDTVPHRQFSWVDRKGNLIRTLGLGDANSPSSARISSNGQTVAFHRSIGRPTVGSMWTMDTADGATSLATDSANSAVWSPNTEHMMFAEQDSRTLQMDLFDRIGPTKEAKHIVEVGSAIKVDDWSSKNFILYERSQGVYLPSDLMALPLDGGESVRVTQTGSYSERNGRFSPDGAWVAYQSNELESRNEVFLQPFPGSTNSRKRVSFNGGTFPQWSSDGLELYFLSADNQLMAVPVPRSENGQDIVLGQGKSLFALAPGSEFEVAADGKRFLINAPAEAAPPIFVLSNWADKLPAVSSNSTSSPLVVLSGRPREYGAQTQIVVLDRQKRLLHTIKDTGLEPALAISRDGTRVAYLRVGDIWVYDLETANVSRIASNVVTGFKPVWSPDGARIAYRASRNGVEGVYVTASDGTGTAERIYSPASNLFNWSMDGRFLVITAGANFAVLPVDGDHKPVSIMPIAGKGSLVLGPESRLLAYLSNATSRNEVYVRSFDPASATELATGAPRKVSTQGSPGMIRWNTDGKELYYLASDGGLMAVSDADATAFDKQSSTLLFPVPDNFPLVGSPGTYADISADGQRFVFAVPAPTN